MTRHHLPSLGLLFAATALSSLELAGCSGDDTNVTPVGNDASTEGGQDATTAPDTGAPDAGGDARDASDASPGEDAADAGPCPGCIHLADGLYGPSSIAVNDHDVFWFNAGSTGQGSVLSVPVGGGTVRTVVSGLGGGGSIAIDSANVYVADEYDGYVLRAPLTGVPDGGTATAMAAKQASPSAVAADAANVYWATSAMAATDAGPGAPGGIFKVPQSAPGATPIPIYSGIPTSVGGLAVDATSIYWLQLGSGPQAAILKAPLAGVADGGAPTVLVSGLDSPTAMAIDATSVYWTTSLGLVSKVPLSGVPDGGAPTLLASGGGAFGIAVDGTGVYWTAWSAQPPYFRNGGVLRAPLDGVPDGGAPTLLGTGQLDPSGIAVHGANVFWTNYGTDPSLTGALTSGGSVMQAPK
jgi:sugar lactone lactonase YvrE